LSILAQEAGCDDAIIGHVGRFGRYRLSFHPRTAAEDSLTMSNANTKIEATPVRKIIMGEAYLERKETGKSQRFLCLIGEKGKVLLTFFTPI
jgi:hypothetical protein